MTEDWESSASTESSPQYPDSFVTRDAVYTVRSVDYVPTFQSELRSLFDDPEDDVNSTWVRAKRASANIATSSEEKLNERVRKAKEIIDGLAAPDAAADESE